MSGRLASALRANAADVALALGLAAIVAGVVWLAGAAVGLIAGGLLLVALVLLAERGGA